MNSEATDTAALRGRIADLEQQLRLSDEGVSRLAQRCLELEQKIQEYLAANPRQELHTSSPLLLPKLFYDAGFGLSEQDSLAAPEGCYDEISHTVTAAFELPVNAQVLRLDPGELPCCVADLVLSDERLTFRPSNGLLLADDRALFLRNDPNLFLEGLSRFPAGLKLIVSYHYYPLEQLTHEPLFRMVLECVEQAQSEKLASQQQFAELQQQITALQQQIAEQEARRREYELSLENMRASASWRLTAPLRSLGGLFHRG